MIRTSKNSVRINFFGLTNYPKISHRRDSIFNTCTSLISSVYALEEAFLLSEFLRYEEISNSELQVPIK